MYILLKFDFLKKCCFYQIMNKTNQFHVPTTKDKNRTRVGMCICVPFYCFFSFRNFVTHNLTLYFPGCEDIVADQISVENLVMILNWSSEPHGSSWVHRQALHFLKEEFLNVMHSPVLFDLSKQYLIQAIRSDFLQVSVQTNYPRNTITVVMRKSYSV